MYHIDREINVKAPQELCYQVWSDFERFPRFMRHVESVTRTPEGLWHWKVNMGKHAVEWLAQVDIMEFPKTIAWHTPPDSDIAVSGSVNFQPWSRGTQVLVKMVFTPKLDILPEFLMPGLFDTPNLMTDDDLAQFKILVEAMAQREKEVEATTGVDNNNTGSIVQ